MENASFKEEIHELHDEEMKANQLIKSLQNDVFSMSNFYLQRGFEVNYLKEQLKIEQEAKILLEHKLAGYESVKDIDNEIDFIIKKLHQVKIDFVHPRPKKEYQLDH